MRIYEIDGSQERALTTDIDQIKDLIWRDCRPFLQAIDLNPAYYRLYRGDRKANGFERQVTRQKRQPKDTPQWTHELIDEYMKENFGHPYRSAAVFATGSMMEASEYGPAFSVFPIGEFSFCWSPKCSDLFKYLDDTRIFRQVDSLINYDTTGNGEQEAYDLVAEELDSLKYRQNDDLMAAIQSQCEIMINCREYYMVECSKIPSTRVNADGVRERFDWLE